MQLTFSHLHSVAFKQLGIVSLLRLAFVFLFILVSNNCFAQRSFSTGQLLSKNISNTGRALLQDNLQFLREENQSMPLVDEYSFRTETDEFNANRQEYLFRMNFNNKSSRDAQDKKTQNIIQQYELKNEILREKELLKRYEYITNWYFADNELGWFAQKRAVLEDKKNIYKKMIANAPEIDLSGLLKTEEDLQKMDQEMLELIHEKNFSIRQLFPQTEKPESYLLQASNWVSLKKIKEVLEKIASSEAPTLEETLQQNEIASAKLEHDIEVAETEKILDFVQVKYAGRDNLNARQEFSLGLSLVLPHKSANRININEAKLEIFDELFQQERLREEIKEDLAVAYAEFDHLMEEYELIQKYIKQSNLEDTYNKYRSNGTVHPLTLLRIKDSILKNQRNLQKIEKAACLLFIDILAYKGLIYKKPSINYLSDDLSFF